MRLLSFSCCLRFVETVYHPYPGNLKACLLEERADIARPAVALRYITSEAFGIVAWLLTSFGAILIKKRKKKDVFILLESVAIPKVEGIFSGTILTTEENAFSNS